MKILEKTMEQMPNSFTSNEFNKKAISNGYPKTLLQRKGLSTFIRKYADNVYEGSKTWVKRSAKEKKEDRQYSFATFDEIISFLKSKGYKIMRYQPCVSRYNELQKKYDELHAAVKDYMSKDLSINALWFKMHFCMMTDEDREILNKQIPNNTDKIETPFGTIEIFRRPIFNKDDK